MSSFIIEGGRPLSGEIVPQGAKNEALQVISATLLTSREVLIDNVPEISDVKNLIELLRMMGVKVERHARGSYSFCASDIDTDYVLSADFVRRCAALRGSVLVVGPILGRFGKAYFPKPGGDKIGRRKVDTHIQGFVNLGATYTYEADKKAYLLESAGPLKGTYMLLDEASVTGTANIIMAAACAEGTSTIYNAACEPYVQQLCSLMAQMGYRLGGIGSNLITVEGNPDLPARAGSPIHHTILPDMIEVGSFIGMAAITRSDLTIKNVSYRNLGIIPESFRRLGIQIDQRGDDIHVPALDSYVIETSLDGSIMNIADAPWPGLTPRPPERDAGCGHPMPRQRAHPSENVREPTFLCRQSHRHGGTDSAVRPPPRRSHRPRPQVHPARQQNEFSGYPCRHCTIACGHVGEGGEHHRQYRTD